MLLHINGIFIFAADCKIKTHKEYETTRFESTGFEE
jgi:hypothetical protein